MSKDLKFDIYRYQLLPKTQNQLELFGKRMSVEELRAEKNDIFRGILSKINSWTDDHYELTSELLIDEEDWYIFRLARKKDIKRATKNFSIEEIDHWPQVTIIINNNPSIQVVCVSNNKVAFSSTSQVINIINNELSDKLNNEGLVIDIRPTFYKHDFWQMIKESQDDIYSLRFELISPNMSNLQKKAVLDLYAARDKYNAQKTVVEFSVDKNATDSSLNIDMHDTDIQNMVDYASEGGGDVSLKRRKFKKTLRMNGNTRTFELEEEFASSQLSFWSLTKQTILNNLERALRK